MPVWVALCGPNSELFHRAAWHASVQFRALSRRLIVEALAVASFPGCGSAWRYRGYLIITRLNLFPKLWLGVVTSYAIVALSLFLRFQLDLDLLPRWLGVFLINIVDWGRYECILSFALFDLLNDLISVAELWLCRIDVRARNRWCKLLWSLRWVSPIVDNKVPLCERVFFAFDGFKLVELLSLNLVAGSWFLLRREPVTVYALRFV